MLSDLSVVEVSMSALVMIGFALIAHVGISKWILKKTRRNEIQTVLISALPSAISLMLLDMSSETSELVTSVFIFHLVIGLLLIANKTVDETVSGKDNGKAMEGVMDHVYRANAIFEGIKSKLKK